MGDPTMMTSAAAYLRGCAMYLLLFMAYGCTDPFMPLIWRTKGLSDHHIGLLGAVSPVSSFLVTPIACGFAEKCGIQQKMLYMALLVYTIARPTVLMAGSFLAVVAVEVSNAIARSPVSSLIDTAVREISGADGFGAQRLWGAVGFGVTSLVGGILCDSDDGGYEGVMFLFVATMLGAMVASTGIPAGRECKLDKNIEDFYPNATDDSGPSITIAIAEKGRRASEASSLTAAASVYYDAPGREPVTQERFIEDGNAKKSSGEGGPQGDERNALLTILVLILGTVETASFFSAVVLSGMAAGVIDTFLFIRLEELGATHLLCGFARLITSLAEIPFFYFSGKLMRFIGVQGMMALAQMAYLARLLYYSVLENPSWVLPVEVLHGLTYAAMWTASLEHAHNIAPESLRTTMRGVVAGLHWGLGFGFGAVLGGILYSDLGPRLCFRASATLPLVSLSLLGLPAVRWWCNKWGEMRNIKRDLNDTFCDMEQCKDCKSCHLQDKIYGSDPCGKADDGDGGFGPMHSIREDGKKYQQWRQQLLPQQQ